MGSAETIKIPQHAHCWICGKAMAYGPKTCSPECQARFDETQKKRKTMMWVMYGAMAVAVGFLLLNVMRI